LSKNELSGQNKVFSLQNPRKGIKLKIGKTAFGDCHLPDFRIFQLFFLRFGTFFLVGGSISFEDKFVLIVLASVFLFLSRPSTFISFQEKKLFILILKKR
jgi:hypothetical protein